LRNSSVRELALVTAMLSADREQYTTDVVVVLRYDGSAALDACKPRLSFARLEPSGVLSPLSSLSRQASAPDPAAGSTHQCAFLSPT
jgi:hypothetical protein